MQKKTILIIDYDDAWRDMLARGLRTNGFECVLANSSESADEILTRIKPDAIVLDRMMPGLDGAAALQKWRARGVKTPVIMLTAMVGPENTIHGLECGADDYLAKPFQLKELVLRLNNIMRNGALPDARLPDGLHIVDDEFYINNKLLALSLFEKELLVALTSPVGNVAAAAPMTAKRLREKISANLKNIDIITVRGRGYKLINK